MKECLNCSKSTKRNCHAYCSNKCQVNYQYREYIEKWKAGLVSGNRGIKTPLLSKHLKRYLLEKFGEKCCLCGWNKRHPITGKVPLEANHIDGNSFNNEEEKLTVNLPELSFTDIKLSQSQQRQRARI